MHTKLCDQLGIEFPIFAFTHCRDVVAAVSQAGGFGVLGAVGFTPEQLEIECKWIDEHIGDKPYGVDIVIPGKYEGMDELDPSKLEEQLRALIPEQHRKFAAKLLADHGVPRAAAGGEAPRAARLDRGDREPQVDVALRHDKVKLIANALGTPPEDVIESIHKSGRLVSALCGRPDQAVKHKDAGVDIIIAQGTEGGGHTGEIGSLVLWPQVIKAVAPTPVLAAGGIGTGATDRRSASGRRAGRVDGLALAHGSRSRVSASSDGVVHQGDQPGHGALALLHRQAVPDAAQRVDRRLGEGRRLARVSRHADAGNGDHGRRSAHPPLRRQSAERLRSTRSARSSV